jgi:hypothetical protein
MMPPRVADSTSMIRTSSDTDLVVGSFGSGVLCGFSAAIFALTLALARNEPTRVAMKRGTVMTTATTIDTAWLAAVSPATPRLYPDLTFPYAHMCRCGSLNNAL